MIVENTQILIALASLIIILCGFAIYFGNKKSELNFDVVGILVGGMVICILFVFLTQEPYRISPEIQKVILNEIPETSQYYRYQSECEEGVLTYLDESYNIQTAHIHPDNLKIEFKDDIKEPYMLYQKAETFFGKDLGLYKVDIYLPK